MAEYDDSAGNPWEFPEIAGLDPSIPIGVDSSELLPENRKTSATSVNLIKVSGTPEDLPYLEEAVNNGEALLIDGVKKTLQKRSVTLIMPYQSQRDCIDALIDHLRNIIVLRNFCPQGCTYFERQNGEPISKKVALDFVSEMHFHDSVRGLVYAEQNEPLPNGELYQAHAGIVFIKPDSNIIPVEFLLESIVPEKYAQ